MIGLNGLPTTRAERATMVRKTEERLPHLLKAAAENGGEIDNHRLQAHTGWDSDRASAVLTNARVDGFIERTGKQIGHSFVMRLTDKGRERLAQVNATPILHAREGIGELALGRIVKVPAGIHGNELAFDLGVTEEELDAALQLQVARHQVMACDAQKMVDGELVHTHLYRVSMGLTVALPTAPEAATNAGEARSWAHAVASTLSPAPVGGARPPVAAPAEPSAPAPRPKPNSAPAHRPRQVDLAPSVPVVGQPRVNRVKPRGTPPLQTTGRNPEQLQASVKTRQAHREFERATSAPPAALDWQAPAPSDEKVFVLSAKDVAEAFEAAGEVFDAAAPTPAPRPGIPFVGELDIDAIYKSGPPTLPDTRPETNATNLANLRRVTHAWHEKAVAMGFDGVSDVLEEAQERTVSGAASTPSQRLEAKETLVGGAGPGVFTTALDSNGVLMIVSEGQDIELPLDHARRLLRYLDGCRSLLVEAPLGELA